MLERLALVWGTDYFRTSFEHTPRQRSGLQMNHKLRRQIAWQAARLMYDRQETEYYRAKMKAARSIVRGWVKPADLPSNAEIRDEIQNLARIHEGDQRLANLREMRLEGLRMMRILRRFRPRIIGSVFTGHIRSGSDIDLHVFSDSVDFVTAELDYEGIEYDVVKKQVTKNGETQLYRHVHIADRFPFELTVYPSDKAHFVFKSSITGKAIERASIAEFEKFLLEEYPGIDLDSSVNEVADSVDRFQVYFSLLLPLENVKQNPKYHPEGDALYHSLQVFDLASNELPYDEEFLLAALLHDVGKGIDPGDHVMAGLEALDGFITERTAWLIRHHMDAHRLHDGTLGARAKRRLQQNESFDELELLSRCDRGGRKQGVTTSELEEALDYLREIATNYG